MLDEFVRAYKQRFDLELAVLVPVVAIGGTTVLGQREKVDLSIFRPSEGALAAAETGTRDVYFDGEWRQARIYDRDSLPLGAVIEGPAIVEQSDSTLVLDPGTTSRVDEYGNIVVAIDQIPAAN